MQITDLLNIKGISINTKVNSKNDAIEKLVSLHKNCGNISDSESFKAEILKREELGTTAVGMEVAIPHAKSRYAKSPSLSAITVKDGVDYDSPDGKPCKLLFMIAATTDGDTHLEVLSRLMQLLMDEEFTEKLKSAETEQEFLDIIDSKEREKFPAEYVDNSQKEKRYRVLAVTSCPTGIAHTYMAAESLQKAGEQMGVSIKVETNGSGGVKNKLTAKEIEECDGIIVAADKSVETQRFDGKRVYTTKVADGINKPEELINIILENKAPVYHSDKKVEPEISNEKESFGRQLYKHLMNGVSHMLPFVVAGGIFIAIAFLIDSASGVSAQGNSAFGTVTPVANWFKTIGGYAFNFMLPILAGFIAKSIADRPGLLVGFVGGFLASNGATFYSPTAVDTVPSGFLGALFAGFAGGYLMLLIEKLCDKLPESLEGIKPVLIYPLTGLGVIGVMMCAVNPVMGFINIGLNNGLAWLSQNNLGILLGLILGAMMSIDMGGPFNKAAYVFGTGMLTVAATSDVSVQNICYQIMASVMAGGMTPPLVIALSTTFFKNRWTEDERKNGIVNYIMGFSFITEGAIPYAASYPLKVIPACAIGSAIAGGLSWLFGCTLMAPHGGIFVIATIGNPLMYLLSLLIGATVGMVLLGIFKKPLDVATDMSR